MTTSQTTYAASFLLDLSSSMKSNANLNNNSDLIQQTKRVLVSILSGGSSSLAGLGMNGTNNGTNNQGRRVLQLGS
jgi:hypothetical protein